jgi:peptidoglycan hydrolase-like protein with peptidoglycan-binding domain
MAGSYKPGPLGRTPEIEDLNDGTLIRRLSPRPGPIGIRPSSIADFRGNPPVSSLARRSPRKEASQTTLQVLRQGSQGPEVNKLQRLINARLALTRNLAIDGVFGPSTHQAVIQYQQGVSLTADGIVGKETWYHLLKGDKVAILPIPVLNLQSATTGSTAACLQKPAPVPAVASGVWEWPLEDKFAEALRRTLHKLPGSIRHEFAALLSPTNLATMTITLVIWAGSHAFGVGEFIDAILLVGGVFYLGRSVFEVAEDLGDFLFVTSTAEDEDDLDEGASFLAKAIVVIGVAAYFALLARVFRGRAGKSKPEAPRKPSRSEPAPVTVRPKPAAEPAPRSKTTRMVPSGRTVPTGTRGGRPTGRRTKIRAQDDTSTKRSHQRENESADMLANAGYKVEQNPTVSGTKKPDYLIEGRRFDCKAPDTPPTQCLERDEGSSCC